MFFDDFFNDFEIIFEIILARLERGDLPRHEGALGNREPGSSTSDQDHWPSNVPLDCS